MIKYLEDHLQDNSIERKWDDVLLYYWEQEEYKWQQHGNVMKNEQRMNTESIFKSLSWYEIIINVNELFDTYMVNAGWTFKLGCNKTHCEYFYNELECEKCYKKHPNTIKLEDIKNNFIINKHSKYAAKIYNMQKMIIENSVEVFTIIVDDGNIPYFYDGNTRITALSLMDNVSFLKCKVYYGR